MSFTRLRLKPVFGIKHPLIRQIGFQDANLKRIRDTVGIKDVVICAMSHMCVKSAIRSTNDFG